MHQLIGISLLWVKFFDSMSEFKICKKCDFEWYANDSITCPVCNTGKIEEAKLSGVFGTASNQERLNMWFKALGLIVLIYMLIQFIL